MTAPITPEERIAWRDIATYREGEPYATVIPRLLDALDTAEKRAEHYRTQRDEWFEEESAEREKAEVERDDALAEVARLREEAARPAPEWDEDAVTEAVARAMYFEDCGVAPSAEIATGEDYEPFREYARIALAVVREHLP